MAKRLVGIHHITAIASDPQRNLDFYTRVLGLRLVKLTVNFDDPATYHFYFGDQIGHPGTVLTFFPWQGARRGSRGNGQVGAIAFSIPESAIGYWQERLRSFNVVVGEPVTRFEETALPFQDLDGMQLALVAVDDVEGYAPWIGADVPEECAIRTFHHATLWEEGYEQTASLLTETLGFRLVKEEENRFRFAVSDRPGGLVDVLVRPTGQMGRIGAGIVHHIAWRTPDDEQQLQWRRTLAKLSYNVTPVMDRQYFHSIYFREPGGVLFEIATDLPGFTLDEPVETLGTALKLPPWLEERRSLVEQTLPAIALPHP